MRCVVVDDEFGIYLGRGDDSTFWSRSCTDCPVAITFPDEDSARCHLSRWPRIGERALRFVKVRADVSDNTGRYATAEALLSAGLAYHLGHLFIHMQPSGKA